MFVVLLIAVSRKSWVWWQDIWIFAIRWEYHVSYGVCKLWFWKLSQASKSDQTLCNKRSWGMKNRDYRVSDHWHWGKLNSSVMVYVNLNRYNSVVISINSEIKLLFEENIGTRKCQVFWWSHIDSQSCKGSQRYSWWCYI